MEKICRISKLEWNEPVSFYPHIDVVEHVYNCNIYVLNLNDVPVLGSTVSLFTSDSLVYKTGNRNNKHYFLLYDEKISIITLLQTLKVFLACVVFAINV